MLATPTASCWACRRTAHRAASAAAWYVTSSSSSSLPRHASTGAPRQRRTRQAYFATRKGLVEAAFKTAAADPSGRGVSPSSSSSSSPPSSILVPFVDPPDKFFTNLGPDVVPPALGDFRSLPKDPAALRGLAVRYSRKHVLHPWSMRDLEGTPAVAAAAGASGGAPVGFASALAEATLRRYAAQHARAPLWFLVLSLVQNSGASSDSEMGKSKKPYRKPPRVPVYVQQTLRRRVQRAFRAALRARGYDEAGRPQDHTNKTAALYGTVRITATVGPLVHLPYTALVAALASTVAALEPRLAQTRGADRPLAAKPSERWPELSRKRPSRS